MVTENKVTKRVTASHQLSYNSFILLKTNSSKKIQDRMSG
jgi:hypothetical protein